MGFKIKNLRKVVKAPVKVVKAAVSNKTVQAVGRSYLAMQTGGASEAALGRLKNLGQSEGVQAAASVYSDVASQMGTPATTSMSSTTDQANAVVSTQKNQERGSFGHTMSDFGESVSRFTGDASEKVGGKKVLFAAIGGVLILLYFMRRKK